MFDHASGIGLQSGHSAANVAVNLDDLFDRGSFKKGRCHTLLYTKNNTLASCNLYGVSLCLVAGG